VDGVVGVDACRGDGENESRDSLEEPNQVRRAEDGAIVDSHAVAPHEELLPQLGKLHS